jgi:hypothetical protein
MSAPQTNIETQKRRHWGPLFGIALAVLVGAVMAVLLTFNAADDEGAPLSPSTEQGETVPDPGANPADGTAAPAETTTPQAEPATPAPSSN